MGDRFVRTIFAGATLALAFMGSAMAVEYRTPVTKQLFTCAGGGVSRVAAPETPAPCCEGQLRCAQFLSTTGILKPMRDPRT